MSTDSQLHDEVRERYAAAARAVTSRAANPLELVDAAGCCTPASATAGSTSSLTGQNDSCCGGSGAQIGEAFGASLYGAPEQDELPEEALLASLGCGNPTAVADLREGETVLDLGSGGGIDVLLSARRVGPTGRAFGVDMTDEMLALAESNRAAAGVSNVQFLKGTIESVPLPDAAVDVVISNCVINLSTDKPAVLAEMFRVLKPGGRIGVSDVVAEDHLTPADRAERGTYVGCIAGALSRQEYLTGLEQAGFTGASVEFTHEAAPGMHAAVVRATKPTGRLECDADRAARDDLHRASRRSTGATPSPPNSHRGAFGRGVASDIRGPIDERVGRPGYRSHQELPGPSGARFARLGLQADGGDHRSSGYEAGADPHRSPVAGRHRHRV